MEDQAFRLPKIIGKTYQGETVTLDGFWYERCEFINCTLIYSGGHSACKDSKIHPDTVWQLQGDAARMMQILQEYGWRFEFGTGPEPEPIRFPSDAL